MLGRTLAPLGFQNPYLFIPCPIYLFNSLSNLLSLKGTIFFCDSGTPSSSQRASKHQTPQRNITKPPPELDIFIDLNGENVQEFDSSPVRKKRSTRASKSSLSETTPAPKVTRTNKKNANNQKIDLPTTPVQPTGPASRGRPRRRNSISSPNTSASKTLAKTPIRIKKISAKTPVGSPLGTGGASGSGSAVMKTPVNKRVSGQQGAPMGSPSVSSGGTPAHAKKNAKGETPLHVAVIKVMGHYLVKDHLYNRYMLLFSLFLNFLMTS